MRLVPFREVSSLHFNRGKGAPRSRAHTAKLLICEPRALSVTKQPSKLSKTTSANEIQEGQASSQDGCRMWQYFLHSATFKGMKGAGVKNSCILPP